MRKPESLGSGWREHVGWWGGGTEAVGETAELGRPQHKE